MLTLSWARRPWVCSRRRRNMVRGKLRERWILAVVFVSIFKVSLCKYMCQARTMEYYKQRFRKNLAQLLEEEAGEQDGEVTSQTLNWFYSSNCVTAGALLGSSVARVQNPPEATLCSVRLPQVISWCNIFFGLHNHIAAPIPAPPVARAIAVFAVLKLMKIRGKSWNLSFLSL